MIDELAAGGSSGGAKLGAIAAALAKRRTPRRTRIAQLSSQLLLILADSYYLSLLLLKLAHSKHVWLTTCKQQ